MRGNQQRKLWTNCYATIAIVISVILSSKGDEDPFGHRLQLLGVIINLFLGVYFMLRVSRSVQTDRRLECPLLHQLQSGTDSTIKGLEMMLRALYHHMIHACWVCTCACVRCPFEGKETQTNSLFKLCFVLTQLWVLRQCLFSWNFGELLLSLTMT